MKSLKLFLFSASLALFAIGCGGTAAPPSEAEEAANNAKMDEDMKKMMGELGSNPDNPGPGPTATPPPAEATPAPN